ncbi:hypothetical protein [Nocardia sp. XZ_19_369]|uniref:hypothetical protein n=1 Tax=Nocardia sp. XZ_19_369 TaxID=2769487 RepID=UPI001E5D34C1|nr:hypothetical protein [Nocardia sp. XZ_19_369]
MTDEVPDFGLLDTNILILRRRIQPSLLPASVAISAITLAELSSGPHEVRHNDEQAEYDEHEERARRLDVLQRLKASSIRSRSTSKLRECTDVSRQRSSLQGASREGASRT